MYADALGQPVFLASVRQVIRALADVGVAAHGYAAVYAVGEEDWPAWADLALLDAEGAPYSLADFLKIVDCAEPRWWRWGPRARIRCRAPGWRLATRRDLRAVSGSLAAAAAHSGRSCVGCVVICLLIWSAWSVMAWPRAAR